MKDEKRIELVVKLTLAKLEILKLKADRYNWHQLPTRNQNDLSEVESEINTLLTELRTNDHH